MMCAPWQGQAEGHTVQICFCFCHCDSLTACLSCPTLSICFLSHSLPSSPTLHCDSLQKTATVLLRTILRLILHRRKMRAILLLQRWSFNGHHRTNDRAILRPNDCMGSESHFIAGMTAQTHRSSLSQQSPQQQPSQNRLCAIPNQDQCQDTQDQGSAVVKVQHL